jgi:hypothetical protein
VSPTVSLPAGTHVLTLVVMDNEFLTAQDTVIVTVSAATSGLVSDDFNAGVLNPAWSFVDPSGNGSYALLNGQLHLSLPAGQSHDNWTSGIVSPRMMQTVSDPDFDLEVRFESMVSDRYQMQGILVEETNLRFLRFDFYSAGNGVRVYIATIADGVVTTHANIAISSTASDDLYMRVSRTGTQWTADYSIDGAAWIPATSFTSDVAANGVGLAVANFASSGSAPAHTLIADYFLATTTGVNSPPLADAGADLLVVDTDGNGAETIVLDGSGSVDVDGSIVQYEWYENDQLIAIGPAPAVSLGLGSHDLTLIVTDDDGAIGQDGKVVTVSADAVGGPVIDVWYGSNQTVGAIGIPQVWANVLGNCSDADGVTSLEYRLNGGAPVQLTMGPDLRRLANPGDFNADILLDDLVEGANEVLITAVDTLGNASVTSVTVDYISTSVWPTTYIADWSDVSDPNEIAQVVDGKWALEGGGVRCIEPSYDRIMAIGDVLWTDYEASVPVTMHELDQSGFDPPSNAPGIGLGVRWTGHLIWDDAQPAWGYEGFGAVAFYRWEPNPTPGCTARRTIYEHPWDLVAEDTSCEELQFGVTYVFKVRVETTQQGQNVSMKIWEQGLPEPAGWDLVATDVDADAPLSGSLVLISHHVDATFGTVVVTPVN